MKAAIVKGPNQMPIYGDFIDPQPATGENLIAVTAAAISHVVKGRAAGTHYSGGGFPMIPGIDGVGRLEDGRRVYFALPNPPFGSMAERVAVSSSLCIPLPDGLDDVTAAAIANPGLSAWAAYTERARLQPGETVLVNGATGTAGRLAVQIAKHLGAGKVIATGRNPRTLATLAALGADVTIALTDDGDALEERCKPLFADGVDVVIDYLWGRSAERLLIAAAKAAPDSVPLRFVQVGSSSGAEINLHAAVLRSSAITMMGSGIGSVRVERLLAVTADVLGAVVPCGLRIDVTPAPLSDVERAWPLDDSAKRTVFTPG